MNAYYLHKPDGTPTLASACGKCHSIGYAFDVAEKCCACLECNEPLGETELKTRSLYHQTCQRARYAKIELARTEKAQLVDDYDGAVYFDGVGNGSLGEGYFANIDELAEYLDDREGERPEFAFCCTSRRVVNADIGRFLEQETDDSYENAEDDIVGTEELEAAFDAFNKANESVLCYDVDYKRKVRIPNAQESQ